MLAIGAAFGVATWAAVFVTSGATGLYVVLTIGVLVSAAAARGVGA